MESGARPVVGVNRFALEDEEPIEVHQLDPDLERAQLERLKAVKEGRDEAPVAAALRALEDAATGGDNLLYPMRDALASYATLGEVSDVLRRAFGEYQPKALL